MMSQSRADAISFFNSGYLWKPSGGAHLGALTNLIEIDIDNAPGLTMEYEFPDPDIISIWTGAGAEEVELPEDAGNIQFRYKSDQAFVLKLQLLDSNRRGHEVFIPYDSPGSWQEVDIPLAFESFTLRFGGTDPKYFKEMKFPIIRLWFGVVRTEGYPDKGSIQFTDMPKK